MAVLCLRRCSHPFAGRYLAPIGKLRVLKRGSVAVAVYRLPGLGSPLAVVQARSVKKKVGVREERK
jgi:hypothetical protein